MSGLLTAEQLAEWQRVFSDGNLESQYVTSNIDNMRALLAHAAALQAQLDAAQAEVARVRDWKNNLFDYLDRDGSLSTSTEDEE